MSLAAMTIVAALHPIYAPAQTKPAFEVISIKPYDGEAIETRLKRSGGRITWTTDLSYMISYAYRLQRDRLSGAVPDSTHAYKVEAMTDPAATDDQVRLMFQAMLADRMKMVTHRVTKESDVLLLSVGKKGSKIKEARLEDPPPPLPEWAKDASVADFEGHISAIGLNQRGVLAITGRRVSMSQLADELQLLMKQPVLDRTGLPGKYYFGFRYAGDQAVDSDAPSLPAALQENLGLKLEKGKGPVENLIVDHIETVPTEN